MPIRLSLCLFATLLAATSHADELSPGKPLPRTGDEIVVCGQLFHTTAPVVTWMDPGGYDAYRVERRFSPWERAEWDESKEDASLDSPNRYSLRKETLTPEAIERLRGGGWSLDELQGVVDQFVLHYDVCGVSRRCFQVLHDARCLSVHFMVDIDGTIYQTLDLKERAWHATTSNGRSVGVEIAHIGAYTAKTRQTLDRWYTTDPDGRVRLTVPERIGNGIGGLGVRSPDFVGRPARNELVVGEIQGTQLYQYDFTAEQYDSLTKLTATLCRVFPNLKCTYPQDSSGEVFPRKLDDPELRAYQGVLGHYHIQDNKTDPGPALNWRRIVGGAQQLLNNAEGG
ncbi:N-acetylmuramoyl-L-alanine amidase [Botrimarina hoheduenensis]|uniref:N-acetylmuramoyl-L-alanine amidase n=1 Tax=Botrimarina hoheduenensis TaxID=2528000 RepID=A0A5C5WAF4_9BACT|nr:peptidoglycan recognition family protein [Botrimarina hoheduenensis]TWT47487.1 N-acetyl-anhydromuranmyl-L-alanine amidase [Botrimarina hoheduenensis]